jgi:hypothetical protein
MKFVCYPWHSERISIKFGQDVSKINVTAKFDFGLYRYKMTPIKLKLPIPSKMVHRKDKASTC